MGVDLKQRLSSFIHGCWYKGLNMLQSIKHGVGLVLANDGRGHIDQNTV